MSIIPPIGGRSIGFGIVECGCVSLYIGPSAKGGCLFMFARLNR